MADAEKLLHRAGLLVARMEQLLAFRPTVAKTPTRVTPTAT